jgi:hypothetical protein
MMTDATPRQSVRSPSPVETDRRCWEKVVRAAEAAGAARAAVVLVEEEAAEVAREGRTCIRV